MTLPRSPRPSTALQRDLMAVFMGFSVRRPRKPKLEHHELEVREAKLAQAPKGQHRDRGAGRFTNEKLERSCLAQAPKASAPGVLPRGRGAGRQFTKATAAGAAVARAQRLTPERRREIALAAAAARWGGKKTTE